MWQPALITEIYDQILNTETRLNGELWNFWQLIKIDPEKWQEATYGQVGNGFWVVAICGQRVIWFNDIEEGFNISIYQSYGHLNEYWCNQYQLDEAIIQLHDLIRFGGDITGQASPPI